ncbi:hypothetical protein J4H86_24340 [Spiractinospora alimapuensis]|uniref:hypothetical protein n=1 Tax=Spiractinospora alimapuensis TaxID=2820884 RepID=UPI001F24D789|nr:hypothetical protein [Spiractinospora alimapuensis]QVQ51854.1 hypothetical protein J4H86_24340 [Spiractinospora alimapuensis]
MTHGALSLFRDGDPLTYPHLFVGYNTLPDAPYPMVGFIAQDVEPGAWEYCDSDLRTFLSAGAESLRQAPVPSSEDFDAEHHRLQRMLRIDAQVVVWQTHLVRPGDSAAGQALAENIVEGYLRPGDLEASPAATPTLTAWAVDREGARLTMWVDGTEDTGEPHVEVARPSPQDPVTSALAELLHAQYTWTNQAFGL